MGDKGLQIASEKLSLKKINVNNDVSKDKPITEATEMIQMINPGLRQSLLSCVRKTFPLCHSPFTPEPFLQIHNAHF